MTGTDTTTEIAAYRRAAQTLAWRDCHSPTRCVAYAGTVAAAIREFNLAGGSATGRTFTDALIEMLIADPVGLQASTEIGPVDTLRVERWVSLAWPYIEEQVAKADTVPTLTPEERAHRRAAVEYITANLDPDPRTSATAFTAYADVIAAAKVRWHLGEFDFVEDANPLDLIGDVVAAEPLAAAADAELDRGRQSYVAHVVADRWDDIREKAQDLLLLDHLAA
ncbi:hypothetical protein [Mycobacteroides chelonae]|uniref:hypothetical protein n=1 Tax=Mycobacteroides chelonae TaxID=1774 RepID=UPI0008A9ED43|nr:hypothetical protein [Mycobacteroides chelonae]AYM40366.1 hypothetical protein DYE20_01315 [[Mycobacterium] chelonae subsp. gwanakae]OHU15951.1 hypothetical protein BKG75_12975 [Mycobacteroides chelonae]